MTRDLINYGKLVDEAMHIIVYKVLKDVQNKGLPGSHHFFISFSTKHPDIEISKNLLNKYPKEMTIVLQYQYQDLVVEHKGFSVSLSFGGIREKIYIPFSAITTFADPSVQFGLQFREGDYEDEPQEEIDIEIEEKSKASQDTIITKKTIKKKIKTDDNVISLDKYRKK